MAILLISRILSAILKKMTTVNPAFIEKYQILYQKDPNSKIFAPLAEAYRKMGMLPEALLLAKKGVEKHPNFPSGRVALAKVLIDKKDLSEAVTHLQKAIDLSPENILAHSLLAKTLIELRKPAAALHAYKMLLFLNPNHPSAQNMVKKLESLEAEGFDDDVFTIKNIGEKKADLIEEKLQQEVVSQKDQQRYLERCISLADAFLVRNDYEKAASTLLAAKEKLGRLPEIEKRLLIVNEREMAAEKVTIPPHTKKIAFLERLLLRIEKNQTLY